MPSFNFDIIIIIIILLSIIKGYNRGFYRQLAGTLSLAVPLIIIQIWGKNVLSLVEENTLFVSISNFLYKVLKTITNVDVLYVQKLILYLVLYVNMNFLIKFTFHIFGPSMEDNLLKDKSNSSKVIGSALGLIASYFIIVIGFILIKPITNINEDKPLTQIVIKSNSLLKNDFTITLPIEEE